MTFLDAAAVNFEAFPWNFLSSTKPEIVRSEYLPTLNKEISTQEEVDQVNEQQ